MIMYVSLVRTLWGFWIFDYKLSVLLCISQCVQKDLCNAIPHCHHAFVEGLSQHMFSNFENTECLLLRHATWLSKFYSAIEFVGIC